MTDKEKVIIDYLLNKYPALNEYKSGDRFNLKKKKTVIDIISSDEDKEKYYEWENLRNIRKEIEKETKLKGKVNTVKEEDNKVKDKVKNTVKDKVKNTVKEKVKNIENKISGGKPIQLSESDQIIRIKKQRDNMEIKLNNAISELDDYKLKFEGLLNDHHKSCEERNKLQHTLDGKGWNKSRVEEFNKYKQTYQKCVCGAKDKL